MGKSMLKFYGSTLACLMVSSVLLGCQEQKSPFIEPGVTVSEESLRVIASSDTNDTLVLIAGGEFMMGRAGDLAATDDHWPHRVRINSFRLGATELSNQEFADIYNWAIDQKLLEVVEANNRTVNLKDKKSARFLYTTWSPEAQVGVFPRLQYINGKIVIDPTYANHPVVRVSWFAAVAYCNYRSQKEGLQLVFDEQLEKFDLSKNGYRLPTEAEWEYGAREGGKNLDFSWGDADQVNGNVADSAYHEIYPQHTFWDYNDGYVFTAPIASFRPNALGLYDMSGNAVEWCINWFYRYPEFENTAFLENPSGPDRNPSEGRYKTWRGGGWYDHGLKLMTTNRGFYSPDNAGSISDLGFRLARSER